MNKRIFHILLIIIIGFLAYSNTFQVPFQFDDKSSIVENREIKDLSNFLEPFKMRYIGYLSFALNYKLQGLDVTGYHIVNLIIHIINAILVYFLVILTFKTPVLQQNANYELRITNLIALFSALLFISHPIQTQAVTYIVQRLASLATMFYILSLVMYVKSRLIQTKGSENKAFSASSLIFYSISLISAILAVKTKEMAFTLPIVVTLYEFMFFEGRVNKRVLNLIPLLLTMLIIPLSLIDIDKPVGEIVGDVGEATRLQTQMSRWGYLFTQFRVIVTYIRLIFFPVNQNLLYEYPAYQTFFNINVFLSFVFLFLLFGGGVYLLSLVGKKGSGQSLRVISFGVFWFFITLSVESSIIPIVDVIFEHRVYLPSAGAFIAITSGVFLLANRFDDKRHRLRKSIISGFIFIVVIFSVSTYARNNIWNDSVTLWEDVVRKSPHDPMGLNNLGDAYARKGQLDKAREYFNSAIAINPNFAEAYSNLGVAYAQKGQLDKAAGYFNSAIAIDPNFAKVYNNLGVIYIRQEQLDKAIDYFNKVININPDRAKAYYNLGFVYYLKGWVDKAIIQYMNAIKLQPDYIKAHYDLGVAYSKKGLQDKAEEHFQKAEILSKLNEKK